MMKKTLRIAVWLLLLIPIATGCLSDPDSGRITILHFNDLHGYLSPVRGVGGAARLATVIDQVREENLATRPTLLLFAGDLLQGTPFSKTFKGSPTINFFNRIGLTAAAVGNHEFDFGQNNFGILIGTSQFPWLSANLKRGDTPYPGVRSSMVLQADNGLRIKIIGATTPGAVTEGMKENVAGLNIEDPIEAVRRQVESYGAGIDLVILLSHLGVATDREIAQKVPGIDLIVGGHNHNLEKEPIRVGKTMIVQAGDYGKYIGRADLRIDGGAVTLENYKMIPLDAEVSENQEIAEMVKYYDDQVRGDLNKVVGNAAVELQGRREISRRTESNLADMVCDLVRKKVGADVVLLNGGSFRADIPAGPITMGEFADAMPYHESVVAMVKVKGTAIRAALDHGLSLDPMDNPGRFPQVSGLRFEIDGDHAVNILVNGAPLQDDKIYTVATNQYVAQGGDGYTMFETPVDRYISEHTIGQIVLDYLEQNESVAPKTDDRIRRIAPWSKKDDIDKAA